MACVMPEGRRLYSQWPGPETRPPRGHPMKISREKTVGRLDRFLRLGGLAALILLLLFIAFEGPKNRHSRRCSILVFWARSSHSLRIA